MTSPRAFGLAALLLLPAFAAAEDVWTRNDAYLQSAINDCSAASADDQAVPDKARELAATKAVLAILQEKDRGQIAIVMPGAPVPSGRWGLNVPIGVGARVDRPEASVYAKGLNWLFADPAKVTIYVRL